MYSISWGAIEPNKKYTAVTSCTRNNDAAVMCIPMSAEWLMVESSLRSEGQMQNGSCELSEEDVGLIRIMHVQHSPSEDAELQPASLWLQVLRKAKYLSTICTIAALAACSFDSYQVHGLQQTHQQLQQPNWTRTNLHVCNSARCCSLPCSYQSHES